MATQAQILANRFNAQKSTGPRTVEGKAVVAQNAVTHGLCGGGTVVVGEDPGEFELYRERMLAELEPMGEVESDLAERIVDLAWRLKRAARLQGIAFDSLFAKQKNSPVESFDRKQDADGGSVLGRAIVRDFGDARVLDRLSMYERRIEHSLYRTMAELKRHRILQEVGPGKMWELKRALACDDGDGKSHGRDARATGVVGASAYTSSGGSLVGEAGADGGEAACSVPVRAYLRPEEEKRTPDGVTTNEDKATPCGPGSSSGQAAPANTGDAASDEGRATELVAGTENHERDARAAKTPCDSITSDAASVRTASRSITQNKPNFARPADLGEAGECRRVGESMKNGRSGGREAGCCVRLP